MPSDFHGIQSIEISEGSRPIKTVETAVIGTVLTGAGADPETFPLNRPVLLTDVLTGLDKAGNTGTLPYTLDAIKDQTNPLTVVVRVAEGADEAETTSNLIGGMVEGRRTGIQALLAAKTELGITPRILSVPGLDNQPVATELISLAQKLNGMAYLSCYGAQTKEEAVAYRNHFGAREAFLLWPDFTHRDTVTNGYTTAWATARASGLRAKLDHEQGWHTALTNKPINGVSGLTHDVSFDIQSGATDAGYLNDHQVNTLVNSNGYRIWDSLTCSSDPLFQFENVTRTAQVLKDTIARGSAWSLGGSLVPSQARDLISTIDLKLQTMVTNGYLIGASAWFDERKNPPIELKAGKLNISYDYTPVPFLRQLTLEQRITDTYFADFAAQIANT